MAYLSLRLEGRCVIEATRQAIVRNQKFMRQLVPEVHCCAETRGVHLTVGRRLIFMPLCLCLWPKHTRRAWVVTRSVACRQLQAIRE